MQALELNLPGEFWDSHLYDGRLYLFHRDGSLSVHDWDKLVHLMPWESDVRAIAGQILTRGKDLYTPEVQTLLRSSATRAHLLQLVAAVTARPHRVGSKVLSDSRIALVDSPNFPHADLEIFANTLFVADSSGVTKADLDGGPHVFEKVNDVPALRIAASYGTLAIAAGSEGLFETPVDTNSYAARQRQLREIASGPCQSCDWVGFDLLASSPDPEDSGYVAAFSKPDRKEEYGDERALVGVVQSADLFGETGGILFGAARYLCHAREGAVTARVWNPYKRQEGAGVDVEHTSTSSTRRQDAPISAPIDAAITVFGVVVETESTLVILNNDGTTSRHREPVSWRTFPRSTRYINHLHITKTSSLRIIATTHDYFLEGERLLSSRRPPVVPRYV